MFLWKLYRGLPIKTRLWILCLCYSLCMVGIGIAAQFGNMALYTTISVTVILGAIFCGINISSIIDPIQRAIGYLREIAAGDLTRPIIIRRKTEMSRMLEEIIQLQQAMQKMISGMHSSSGQISDASDMLRGSSAQMSSGTDQARRQSSSVGVAVEELASVSTSISQSCQEMANKALKTEEATRSGEEIICSMSSMMGEIERMVIGTTEAVKALGQIPNALEISSFQLGILRTRPTCSR